MREIHFLSLGRDTKKIKKKKEYESTRHVPRGVLLLLHAAPINSEGCERIQVHFAVYLSDNY
jgi:hypothetical protein